MNDIDVIVKDGCNVFNLAFSESVSKAAFYNKHYNNPYRINRPVRLYYDNDRPVGMNAFMGMHIVDNTQNLTHYVAQSNDSAVISQFRGRHIFSTIVTDFEEHDSECEYSIGIPNDNSYNGFLKMGWRDVAVLKGLFMKRSKVALLKQPSNIPLGNMISEINTINHEFRLESRVFFDQDELIRINKSSEIMTIRSNEYINWKLSNKDGYIISLFKGSEMLGYLIFHVICGRKVIKYNHICIDDWYYMDVPTLNRLLKRVSKWAYYLYIPFVNISNDEYQDFVQCGFEDLPGVSHLIVSPRAYGHDYLKHLSFRMLDGDDILGT